MCVATTGLVLCIARRLQEFEKHAKDNIDTIMPYGVYTLDELRTFGQERNLCPYFLARHAVCVRSPDVWENKGGKPGKGGKEPRK